MRFAHLSDSHLGHKQFGILQRETDFYDVFAKNIDKIIEKDVDFVIHSGDLFDNNRPPAEAIIAFQDALMRFNDAKIPIYAIAGNHDSILREGSMPPQVIFKRLGLKLISPDNPAYLEGPVLICGIPYTASINSHALMEKYNKLSQYAEKYLKSILVSHQGIDKWMHEHSYEVELDSMPKNFDYYAMGHIHNYIEQDFGKGKIVFPGSMELMRTSEVNPNYREFGKGFVVVDLSDDKPQVERVKIDLPREFINAVIKYDEFYESLPKLKTELQSYENKPMLELSVVGGDFNSADIYETVKNTLKEDVLVLRPRFMPDSKDDYPDGSDGGDGSLDPKAALQNKVNQKYGEDVGILAGKLLDELSVGNVEDAKIISDVFYKEHYYDVEENPESNLNSFNEGKGESESNLNTFNEEKAGSDFNQGESESINSDSNLENKMENSEDNINQKSKQMSFDDF